MTDAEQVIHGREEAIICMVENAGALMERIGAMASSLRRECERLRSEIRGSARDAEIRPWLDVHRPDHWRHRQTDHAAGTYGLSMGSDLERLRELAGGENRDLRLYQSFRDPANYGSTESKRFPWMAVGPVSPMASNRPLFINAFDGGEFVEINGIPLDGTTARRPPAKDRVSRASEKYRKQVSYGKSDGAQVGLKDLGEEFNFFKGS